jgi:hypothetical protein
MNIIKNIWEEEGFKHIQSIVLKPNFPWYYGSTVYDEDKSNNLYSYSFCHLAYHDGKNTSELGELLQHGVRNAIEKSGQKINQLIRIRLGLITNYGKAVIHDPHVDNVYPHMTGLIYMNNADGNTIIYKEKVNASYDPKDTGERYLKEVLKDNLTVDYRVTPEENKMMWFDGLSYHSSTSPITVPRRIVLNFNYTV